MDRFLKIPEWLFKMAVSYRWVIHASLDVGNCVSTGLGLRFVG